MKTIKALNERIALWTVNTVATMGCAYLFAIIALVALPQAVSDTFDNGFHPMPLVTWISQAFLQLVLLAVILVGQDIQSRGSEKRSIEQHNAVLEILTDIREVLADVRELLPKTKEEI